MMTLHKEWAQMGSTTNHLQVLKTTTQVSAITPLRFALQAQLFNHHLVLVALHNFFCLLSQNYLRSNRFDSPLPFSPGRLMPGGILVHSHVSGVTNPSCLCPHDAAGRERLWIISAPSPGGDLTLKLQVSVLHKESVKLSSVSLRSCSENLTLPIWDIADVRPLSGDRQTSLRRMHPKFSVCGAVPAADPLTLGFNLAASILLCKRQTTATAPGHAVKLVLCGAQHCSTRLWKNLPKSSAFRQNDSLFQNVS